MMRLPTLGLFLRALAAAIILNLWTLGAADPDLKKPLAAFRNAGEMPDLRKPLTCIDVLANSYTMNVDPCLNTIREFAYQRCIGLVALETLRLRIPPEEREHIDARLREIRPFVKAALMALTAAYHIFKNPKVRTDLTQKQMQASYTHI